MPSLDWYFPWAQIDWVLKLQLLVWLSTVAAGFWIGWRGLQGQWLATTRGKNHETLPPGDTKT